MRECVIDMHSTPPRNIVSKCPGINSWTVQELDQISRGPDLDSSIKPRVVKVEVIVPLNSCMGVVAGIQNDQK